MKRRSPHLLVLLLASCHCSSAADYYVSLSGANIPPYRSWDTAATNIQTAIDFAATGDVVWVTNGVYVQGGKVPAGDLTNRVTLDKALTVRSVNGPLLSIIQGAGATNGAAAVRCAWLTNGALLQGFTLRCGATRLSSFSDLGSGGGVWCASSNAAVANCIIVSNAAGLSGGGVYQGSLRNSFINRNTCSGKGGNAAFCVLINCTITANTNAGSYFCTLTNCIADNLDDSTASYCCGIGFTPVRGNIGADPQLLPDGIHLASTSPCRGAGAPVATGTDIDGEAWTSPASIGCDQWQPAPRIVVQPRVQLTNYPGQFSIPVAVAGQDPFTCWWTQNGGAIENGDHFAGAHTTFLSAQGINPVQAGCFQVLVSNAFGMSTSMVSQLVIHYVNAASTSPVSPYLAWSNSAASIQDAIKVASVGELVLVTNGAYLTNGKIMSGDLLNRVTLDKPLVVQSVNGPAATVIRGVGATNGNSAVRCAWLTNGALLSGFTLQAGATRNSGIIAPDEMAGGGVYCSSRDAVVANCVISSNTAWYEGGGAYQGTLLNCALFGNALPSYVSGGACYSSALNNCTICSNSGYAAYQCALTNCIVYYNPGGNSFGGNLAYCCTLASGTGVITNAPSFVDLVAGDFHLQSNSACINSGANAFAPLSTPDLDGNPRVAGETVDIGAYEFQSPSSLVSYAWLQRYNLPSDGSADFLDADADGLCNWQEWKAGTAPNDPNSALRMLSPKRNGSSISVSWTSVPNRSYTLYRSTNSISPGAFQPLQSDISGQSPTTTFLDTSAGPRPCFYRILVQ